MKKDKNINEEIKITLAGGIVGKTSFLRRYISDRFNDIEIQTVGINNDKKILKLYNGKNIKIKFSDIGGQERYESMALSQVQISHGVIIMYSITNYSSFKKVLDWIKKIRDYKEDIPIIIIGNMCDGEDNREISKKEGEELAQNYNYHFYESSNKLGINIEEPIIDLVEQILKKRYGDKDKNNYKIKIEKNDKEKK